MFRHSVSVMENFTNCKATNFLKRGNPFFPPLYIFYGAQGLKYLEDSSCVYYKTEGGSRYELSDPAIWQMLVFLGSIFRHINPSRPSSNDSLSHLVQKFLSCPPLLRGQKMLSTGAQTRFRRPCFYLCISVYICAKTDG
jgi:hypothetical protein